MKTLQGIGAAVVLLLIGSVVEIKCTELEYLTDIYDAGVNEGVIDPKKYSFEAFERDERGMFRYIYDEYRSMNGTVPLDYKEWLFLNNFGLFHDTKESMFARKMTKRSVHDNKREFVNTVKKGDILITGQGIGGLVGHAAIMTSDYWVLEMPGGNGWANGIPDNNRQVPKDRWFDMHASDWTTVYRCPDADTARMAAGWADRNYYSPTGGEKKVKHITYKLTTDIWSTNPSYCSKLVIHAYYFGTGARKVIKDLSLIGRLIVPSTIPSYFLRPYSLVNKGKY
ncbi:hypothetical protein O3G_MSEX013515 [Manduca sexta]|uniref:Uncharacterized protein n=1 Tax=Manduca sexta TaxID=7130 RepID=A0A921ZS44_MANSE|nr:hypothetical protein O3G_MSEX013515 [Manduca sexta]